MNEMDVSAQLEALLAREGITQSELARRADVSQPTVSRARRRAPERNSQSYARLCNYIQKELDRVALPGPARDALAEIWDGSPAHAEALATLIRAAGDLSRTEGTEDSP
jgi:transcriptional regulator with XRE-family HTH domain